MDNAYQNAFYAKDGSFLALIRNVLFNQLPASLQADFKKNYSGYWISNLFQVTDEDMNVSYYMTIENANKTVVLSAYKTRWSKYETVAKQ